MKIKDITLMSIMLAILIVASKISFNIGPIPITLQTFAVAIISCLLKWKRASIVFLAYIIMGLIGIPVFSTGGGFAYVLTPSFGFIIGFLVSSFITGSNLFNKHKWTIFIKCVLGLLVLDFIGIVYMAIILNLYKGLNYDLAKILTIGFTPFIVKDLISVGIAGLISIRLDPVLNESYDSSELNVINSD